MNVIYIFFAFTLISAVSFGQNVAESKAISPTEVKDFVPMYPDKMKGEDWPKSINKEHPRLFVNNNTLPEFRSFVHNKQKIGFDQLVKEVDALPDIAPFSLKEAMVKKLPSGEKVPNGASSAGIYYFNYNGAEQAVKLALVYLVNGDKKYAQKSKSYLRLFNEVLEWTSKNNLRMEHTGYSRINAFTAYDWICSTFTQEEKKEILGAMLAYTQKASRQGTDFTFRRTFGGPKEGVYGENALVWFAGLAGYGQGVDDALAERFLKEGSKLFVEMLNYREESSAGSGVLGAATVTYSFGDYPHATFNFFHTWKSAFGEDLSTKWTQMLAYPIWFDWTKIKFVNGRMLHHGIGDLTHEDNLFSVQQLYSHYAQIAHFYSQSYPSKVKYVYTYMRDLVDNGMSSKVMGNQFPFLPFILTHFDKDKLKENYAKKQLPCYYSPIYGLLLMRSGEKPDDTYASFRFGASTGNHQHFDELSFTIFKNDFLVLDAGSRTTTAHHHNFAAQSVAHNTILIHHPKEQMPRFWKPVGFKEDGNTYYNHGGQYLKDQAKPLALRNNNEFTYAVGDATKSYSSVKSKEVIRQFLYLKPDIFVIYDRVVSVTEGQRKEFILHFQNEPYLFPQSREWGTVNGSKLMVKTVLPLNPKYNIVGGPGREFEASGKNWELPGGQNWDRTMKLTGKWRVEVSDSVSSERTNFLHVLQATDGAKESFIRTEIKQSIDNKDVLRLTDQQKRLWILTYNRTGKVGLTIEKRTEAGEILFKQELLNVVEKIE